MTIQLLCRSDTINSQIDENLVSNIDDILMIIKSDYEKAYFVTGNTLYLFPSFPKQQQVQ